MNRYRISRSGLKRGALGAFLILVGVQTSTEPACGQSAVVAAQHTIDGAAGNGSSIRQVGNSGNVVMHKRDLRTDAQVSAMINKGLNSLRLPSLMPMPTAHGKTTVRKYVPGRGWVTQTFDRAKLMEEYNRELNEKWGVAPWGKRDAQKSTAQNSTAQKSIATKSAARATAQRKPVTTSDQIVSNVRDASWQDLAGRVDTRTMVYRATQSLLVDQAEIREVAASKEYQAWSSKYRTEMPSHLSQIFAEYDLETAQVVAENESDRNHRELKLQIKQRHGAEVEKASVKLSRKMIRLRNGRSRTAWYVSDVTFPNQNLSLLQLVQYRMIEASPEFPDLAARMHPGRLQQSGQVEAALALNPWDLDFESEFDQLSADTKTWPIVVAKQAQFQRHVQSASRDAAALAEPGESTSRR